MKQSVLLFGFNFLRKKSKSKSNPFVDRAYDHVKSVIKSEFAPNQIISQKQVSELNITPHMKEKLLSLYDVSVFNEIQNQAKLSDELVEFLGIGAKKAMELITAGLKSIEQLRQRKWSDMLSPVAKLMLEHRPETNFSRQIIEKLEQVLTNYRQAEAIIVGSYRRGVKFCNDIDIMLVSNQLDALNRYLGYLSDRLVIIVYNRGLVRVSFLIKMDQKYYKADVFLATKKEKFASLVYATGSREFNIRLRAHAKKLGYLLNQSGLFKIHGQKLVRRSITSERDLFEKLGLKYMPPHLR